MNRVEQARERQGIFQDNLDQGIKRAAHAAGVSIRTARRYRQAMKGDDHDRH